MYREVNSQLNALEIAEWLGLETKNNLVLCPFHTDKHPSMHAYENSYYCFSCGTYADTISLTAFVKGITQYEALKLLNSTFSLGYNIGNHKESEEERELRMLYKRKRQIELSVQKQRDNNLDFLSNLCRYYTKHNKDVNEIESLHEQILESTPDTARIFEKKVRKIREMIEKEGITEQDLKNI